MEAAARPLPREETTPPVTKMYFVATSTVLSLGRVQPLLGPLPHQRRLVRSRARPVVEPRVPKPAEHEPDRRPPRHAQRDQLLAAERAPNLGGAAEVPVEPGPHPAAPTEPRPCELDRRAVAQQRRPAARGGPGHGGQPPAEERPGPPRPEQPGERLAGKAEAPEAGGGDLGRLVAHDRERRQLGRRRREAAPAEPVEGPGEPRKPGAGDAREPEPRIEEPEGARRAQAREGRRRRRGVQHALDLGGDARARARRARRPAT